jgi:glutaminase
MMNNDDLLTQTRTPKIEQWLRTIEAEIAPMFGRGKVADYIPALARVNARQFGMAIALVNGAQYTAGDAHTLFSSQSISKLFTFVLALKIEGDAIWQRIGREPSGNAFNSMVQLESERGIPRNPFINAGALVVTDILTSRYAHLDLALLSFLQRLTGSANLNWSPEVAKSELETAHRNIAMAYFMKSFGNLANTPQAVLDNYCKQCATEMSCAQLAQAAMFLANDGLDVGSGDQVLSPEATRRVNALLLTCGAYDAAGDYAYRIGLPLKTGVGGGIVAVVPNVGTIAVWSPELDAKGNSLIGGYALERFMQLSGWGRLSLTM